MKKIESAKKAFAELKGEMAKIGYSEDDATAISCLLIRTAIEADGFASDKEVELYREVVGIKDEKNQSLGLVKLGLDRGLILTVDRMVDGLSAPAKAAALKLVEAFIDADNVRTKSEQELLDLLRA